MKKRKKSNIFSYFVLIAAIVLLGVSFLWAGKHFNKHIFVFDNSNDSCLIASNIQSVIKKIQPKSSLFVDFGGMEAYNLKQYVNNVSYQYEEIRSLSGIFEYIDEEENPMSIEDQKRDFMERLALEQIDSECIVFFCSPEHTKFCMDIIKSLPDDKYAILVKVLDKIKYSYDFRGFPRCLVK